MPGTPRCRTCRRFKAKPENTDVYGRKLASVSHLSLVGATSLVGAAVFIGTAVFVVGRALFRDEAEALDESAEPGSAELIKSTSTFLMGQEAQHGRSLFLRMLLPTNAKVAVSRDLLKVDPRPLLDYAGRRHASFQLPQRGRPTSRSKPSATSAVRRVPATDRADAIAQHRAPDVLDRMVPAADKLVSLFEPSYLTIIVFRAVAVQYGHQAELEHRARPDDPGPGDRVTATMAAH